MAISINTVWECRASGAGVSDNNGGGFVAGSGGTDRSQQGSPQVAVGGGVVTSSITTTVVTFTGGTYTVLAGDIGNIVQFISGTNVTAGFYQITAVSAGLNGTWTLDRTPLTSGTTTNAVANMGGALLTLGKLAGAMIASNKAYCTGSFTVTTTPTFAQAVTPPSAANPYTRVIGYGATRGDGLPATLTLGAASIQGFLATGGGFSVEYFTVDCASLATTTGISFTTATGWRVQNCKLLNFTVAGISTANGNPRDAYITECEVTGGVAGATAAISVLTTSSCTMGIARCFIHDNACPGISATGPGLTIQRCLVVNNSGATSDGIVVLGRSRVLQNTIHNNGRDGLQANGTTGDDMELKANLLTNNGRYGLNNTMAQAMPADPAYDGNGYFGNGTAARNNYDSLVGLYAVTPYTNTQDLTLSVSPYVGPTTGTSANFALNATAGGGAACKVSAQTWPGNTGTAGVAELGAVGPVTSGTVGIIMATG